MSPVLPTVLLTVFINKWRGNEDLSKIGILYDKSHKGKRRKWALDSSDANTTIDVFKQRVPCMRETRECPSNYLCDDTWN